MKWEFRGYHTNIDNLIVTVTDPKTFLSSAENLGKAQIDALKLKSERS